MGKHKEKIKNQTRLSIVLKTTDRAGIRAEIFQHWIAESPGTTEMTNHYRYDVERLSDGTLIYVTRPTRLNKGADFKIFCENFKKYKKGTDKPPSHNNLVEELREIVKTLDHKSELLKAIRRIWNCEPSDKVIADLNYLAGNVKVERVLLLLKWFFIEQDVTYWIESGRCKLLGFLEEHFEKIIP